MCEDDPEYELMRSLGAYESRLYDRLEQAVKDGDSVAAQEASKLIDELHENF